ncbi:MAG: hypothetical protein WD045_06460 [Pirellulaceae bacterium]
MLTASRFHVTRLMVVLCALALGCAQEESQKRYHVSGTVTHEGNPVSVGTIQFRPDSMQGNSGPPGFADIKEGKFDTKLSGKGTIGGPHLVTIDAFDGQNIDPDIRPNGDTFVSGYQQKIDLEKESETQLTLELTTK